MGKAPQTAEVEICVQIPSYPVIEASGGTLHGQGCKHTSLFDNIHAITMRQGRRRDRSEPQRRHDLLLHKSHHDPLTYYKTSLEDLSKTVAHYREATRIAETDARQGKKALVCTQDQVGPSQV